MISGALDFIPDRALGCGREQFDFRLMIESIVDDQVDLGNEETLLITIGTLTVWTVIPPVPDVEPVEAEEPVDPPQAVSAATMAPHTATLSFLVSVYLPLGRTVGAGNGVH